MMCPTQARAAPRRAKAFHAKAQRKQGSTSLRVFAPARGGSKETLLPLRGILSQRGTAATKDQVFIAPPWRADCRLSIEEVVWQLPPLSISPPRRVNRKSAIPDILGQTTIAEILRKTRRISETVLQLRTPQAERRSALQ
jgi:hypothetical protein